MGLFDFLGGNDEKKNPVEELIQDEEQIVTELEALQEDIEEALNAEKELVEALEADKHRGAIEQEFRDLKIFLKDDIEGEEKTINAHVENWRQLHQAIDSNTEISEIHGKLARLVKDIVAKTDSERERLEHIGSEIENELDKDNFSHDEVMQRIESQLSENREKAYSLEEEISRAENLISRIESPQTTPPEA